MQHRLKLDLNLHLSLPVSPIPSSTQSPFDEVSLDIADDAAFLSVNENPLYPTTLLNAPDLSQRPSTDFETLTAQHPRSKEFALHSPPPGHPLTAVDTSPFTPHHPPEPGKAVSADVPTLSPAQSQLPQPKAGSEPAHAAATKAVDKISPQKAHPRGKLYDLATGIAVPTGTALPKEKFKARQYVPLEAYVRRFIVHDKESITTYVDDAGNRVDTITNQTLYNWRKKKKKQEFSDILAKGGRLPLPPVHTRKNQSKVVTSPSPLASKAGVARIPTSSSRISDSVLSSGTEKPMRAKRKVYNINTGLEAPKGTPKSEQDITFEDYVSRFVKKSIVSLTTYVDAQRTTLYRSQLMQKRKAFRNILDKGRSLPPILKKKWTRLKNSPSCIPSERETTRTSTSMSRISDPLPPAAPAPSGQGPVRQKKPNPHLFFEKNRSGITKPAAKIDSNGSHKKRRLVSL